MAGFTFKNLQSDIEDPGADAEMVQGWWRD